MPTTPVERARFIAAAVLYLVTIGAIFVALHAITRLLAKLAVMVWPGVITVVTGIGAILLGWIFASTKLLIIGGSALGIMILASIAIAMEGGLDAFSDDGSDQSPAITLVLAAAIGTAAWVPAHLLAHGRF